MVSLFNGISTLFRLFNAKAILLVWYYLTHSWEDTGVHSFPKGICPKVNVIARLEYELAYYDSTVHHFNHYTTRTPLFLTCKIEKFWIKHIINHCREEYISWTSLIQKPNHLGGLRICRLNFCRGVRPCHIDHECPGYHTKLHMMVRLQSWSFGECGVSFHCHYSQVHSEW